MVAKRNRIAKVKIFTLGFETEGELPPAICQAARELFFEYIPYDEFGSLPRPDWLVEDAIVANERSEDMETSRHH